MVDNEEIIELIDNFINNIAKPSFEEIKQNFSSLDIKDFDNSDKTKAIVYEYGTFPNPVPLYLAAIDDDCKIEINANSKKNDENIFQATVVFKKGVLKDTFEFELKNTYTVENKANFKYNLENSIKFLYKIYK